jgi:hypothetical protein
MPRIDRNNKKIIKTSEPQEGTLTFSPKELKEAYKIVCYDVLDNLQKAELGGKVKVGSLGYFSKTKRNYYLNEKGVRDGKARSYLAFSFKLSKPMKK